MCVDFRCRCCAQYNIYYSVKNDYEYTCIIQLLCRLWRCCPRFGGSKCIEVALVYIVGVLVYIYYRGVPLNR